MCRFCPYYTTILEPGDVLYNPPWWSHAIRNITEKSVGVANRMMTGGVMGSRFRYMDESHDINRKDNSDMPHHYSCATSFFFGITEWPASTT